MSLIVGIHYEPLRQFSDRLLRFENILKFNNIKTVRLCSSDLNFWQKIKNVNLFIYCWRQWDAERQNAKAILPVIEHELKICCFPNSKTWWSYDDKIKEYYLMKVHDFPMVKSWIFWEYDIALKWAQQYAELPVVFKLSGGAGSSNVILIKHRKDLLEVIKLMFEKGIADQEIPTPDSLSPNNVRRLLRSLAIFKKKLFKQKIPFNLVIPNWQIHKNYILFQKYLPNNDFDTRVTVIGDRAFAFRRFNRDGDFRSSGSGKIDYDISKIDLDFIKIALDISKQCQFQSMAYDFLYDTDGQKKFCEISYNFIDRAIYNCPGYWDNNLKWHQGHYWPQYFQLMDALQKCDLKQPENISDIKGIK